MADAEPSLPAPTRTDFGDGECLLRPIDELNPHAGLRCRRDEHHGRACRDRWRPPRQRQAA